MNNPTLSRRDVLALAAGSVACAAFGPAASAAPTPERSTVRGVKIGAQTYSFHDIPNDGGNHVDQVIADMQACGLYTCELWPGHIEASTYVGIRPPPADCPKPDIGCAPDKRYNIPCMIEIEHIGTTSATGEVKIAYEYCKRELAKA